MEENHISDTGRENRVAWSRRSQAAFGAGRACAAWEGGSNPGPDRGISTIRRAGGPWDQRGKAEVQMVEIARKELVMVFRVLDRDGRPIGEIVQPKVAPVVGRGARTVLLVRGKPGGKTQPAAM
jgi:hypothetical protein